MGGLRFDQKWNYVADLTSFAQLKVAEDKRYYPGIGIYHILSTSDTDSIPIMSALHDQDEEIYYALASISKATHEIPRTVIPDVSVLCAAYIPPWAELKDHVVTAGNAHLELSESFHSPSYDFVVLKKLLEQYHAGNRPQAAMLTQLSLLKNRMHHLLSFNSPIHLPWAAELSDMSYGLIGKATNAKGDYAVRYGIGHHNQSLEIREYSYGISREFPYGLSSKTAYGLRIYTDSPLFQGKHEEYALTPDTDMWKSIQNHGFIKGALEVLQS
jgi:hypothetical protein